jgi:hypothetical protein
MNAFILSRFSRMVCTLKTVRSGWSDANSSRTAASVAAPRAPRTRTVARGARLRTNQFGGERQKHRRHRVGRDEPGSHIAGDANHRVAGLTLVNAAANRVPGAEQRARGGLVEDGGGGRSRRSVALLVAVEFAPAHQGHTERGEVVRADSLAKDLGVNLADACFAGGGRDVGVGPVGRQAGKGHAFGQRHGAHAVDARQLLRQPGVKSAAARCAE